MPVDPNTPACCFCEKRLRPLEPFMPFSLLVHPSQIPPDAVGVVSAMAPVHVGCFMRAMAGEVADAVLDALESGKTSVGLDREPGLDLNEVVAGLVARVVKGVRRT